MSQPPGGYPPGGPPGGAPPGTGAQPQGGAGHAQQHPAPQARYPQAQYPQAQYPQAQYPQAQVPSPGGAQAETANLSAQQPTAPQGYPRQQETPAQPDPGFPAALEHEAPERPPYIVAQHRRARFVALLGLLTFAFGVICMLTSLYFTFDAGKAVRGSFGPEGGTVGPFQTTEDNQVLEIDFRQHINGYGWAYISGEIEDAEQEPLLGFGGEAWHEQGYDDGHWDEREEEFELKVTVPEKGTYYAAFEVEQQPNSPVGGQMDVSITPKAGSAVPHFAAGLFGLILGVVLGVAGFMMVPVQVEVEDD
ncbi:MAG: hypothetical protein KC766_18725 [Myxococcales bacterium]|nr:hypothetical protein [Myxococcales bacterium]